MHLTVALLPEIPEPLVMHLLVLCRGDETASSLCLVDRPIPTDLCPTRLRLRYWPQRLRSTFSVIEAMAVTDDGIGIVMGQNLRMKHSILVGWCRRFTAHARAPFK